MKKVKVKTLSDKILQIFEHTFGNLTEFTDFNTRRDARGVRDSAKRIARGLTKYLSEPNIACPAARVALLLEKMLFAKMWWDNSRTATRQLPSISKFMAESLTKNGYNTIEKIARASSVMDLARASGRKSNVTAQFGNKLVSEALKVPYGEIVRATFDGSAAGDSSQAAPAAQPTTPSSPRTLYIRVRVDMRNHQPLEAAASGQFMPPACFMLVVHTEEKKGLLYFREAEVGEQLVRIQMTGLRCDNKSVIVSLINRRYVGVDSNCSVKVPGPHHVSQAKAGTRVLKNAPSNTKNRGGKSRAGNRDLKEMLMSQQSVSENLHSQSSSSGSQEGSGVGAAKREKKKKNDSAKKTTLANRKRGPGENETLGIMGKRKRIQFVSPLLAGSSESSGNSRLSQQSVNLFVESQNAGDSQPASSAPSGSSGSYRGGRSRRARPKKSFVASPQEENEFKFASEIGKNENQNDDLFSDSDDDDTDKFLAQIHANRLARDAKFSSNASSEEEPEGSSRPKPKRSTAGAKASSIPRGASAREDDFEDLLDELMDDDDDDQIMQSIEACEKLGSLANTKKSISDPYIESLFDDEDEFFSGSGGGGGGGEGEAVHFVSKAHGGAHAQSSSPEFDSDLDWSQVDSQVGSQQDRIERSKPSLQHRSLPHSPPKGATGGKRSSMFNAWQYRGPEDGLRASGPSQEQIDEAEAAEMALSERTSPNRSKRSRKKERPPKRRKSTDKHAVQKVRRNSAMNGGDDGTSSSSSSRRRRSGGGVGGSDGGGLEAYENYAAYARSHGASQQSSQASSKSSQRSTSFSQSSDFQRLSGKSHAQSHSQQHLRQQAAQRHYDMKRFDVEKNKTSKANGPMRGVSNSISVGMISDSYRKSLGSALKSRPKARSRAPVSCSGTLASLTPSPTPTPPPSQETNAVAPPGVPERTNLRAQKTEWGQQQRSSLSVRMPRPTMPHHSVPRPPPPLPQQQHGDPVLMAQVVSVHSSSQGTWIPQQDVPPPENHRDTYMPTSYAVVAPPPPPSLTSLMQHGSMQHGSNPYWGQGQDRGYDRGVQHHGLMPSLRNSNAPYAHQPSAQNHHWRTRHAPSMSSAVASAAQLVGSYAAYSNDSSAGVSSFSDSNAFGRRSNVQTGGAGGIRRGHGHDISSTFRTQNTSHKNSRSHPRLKSRDVFR